MTEALITPGVSCGSAHTRPRLLGVFAAWRLQAYGYTLAAVYAAFFLYVHWLRLWLVNSEGVPVYHDFTNMFVAGWEALHGHAASAYDPVAHLKAQEALVGTGQYLFAFWPCPPTDFLLLAPLATLPYATAFLTWEAATLLGFVAVIYLIVRRRPAIALVLASPFTFSNFVIGQTGFLTASLTGAALLALERRPALAGVFIGCLTYKPQLGILFPLALIAGNQWRAFASAVITASLLAGVSIAMFGIGPWQAFPRELLAQASTVLIVGPGQGADPGPWGILQTVYGLIRYLNGGATLAWLAQGVTTSGIGLVVWLVWRSPARYALKAAILSAGLLLATPYAQDYDMAAIAVPVAFLAEDQLSRGLLRGEQIAVLALFAASLSTIPTVGRAPVGVLILLTLLVLMLRRAFRHGEEQAVVA